MLHACGNGNNDIAESLGVTTANASKLVQRGLIALRERLGRTGVTVGASMLLAVMTSQSATSATEPTTPLTLHVLNHASTNASLLAKGTTMHLTLTSASTWILTAGLVAAVGVGVLVASDAFSQTPTPSRQQALVEQPPVPVPVPVSVANEQGETEKGLEQQLLQQFTIDFQDVSAHDVVEYLRTKTGISIIVHPHVYPHANFGIPVTFKAKDMSLRAILNNIAKLAVCSYFCDSGQHTYLT